MWTGGGATPDFTGEAHSAPQTLWLDLRGEEKERGKRERETQEKWKGGRGKGKKEEKEESDSSTKNSGYSLVL